MIQLTDSALSAVRTAIAGAGPDVEGLRIMVEAGGCAGFKYMMGLVSEANPSDVLFAYLDGAKVDFVIGLEGSGFTFDNPQAKSSCSCGKSFG